MKNFAKYTLITDMKLNDVDKALGDKINQENENNTGIWDDRYGLVTLGGIEEKGVDYVAFQGEIRGNTQGECKQLLSGFKKQIKTSLPGVKNVSDQLVAFGNYI